MKKTIFIISSLLLFLFSCRNDAKKEEAEIKSGTLDSTSKQQQKMVVDSLKKKNPLLIMPPDSNYTGEYIDKYDNGIIKFKGNFRQGKRHGQWMSFYPTGLPWSELHFDKGLRAGPNFTYYEDGKVRYKGNYKNDVRDSVWMYYDSLGNLAQKVIFKNDHIIKKLPLN